jgi:plasmid stabilization system protein ParE
VFVAELEQALRVVASLPGAATPYQGTGLSGVRIFLRKSSCHVYYTFDERAVIVRAVWGARRRREPRIAP